MSALTGLWTPAAGPHLPANDCLLLAFEHIEIRVRPHLWRATMAIVVEPLVPQASKAEADRFDDSIGVAMMGVFARP